MEEALGLNIERFVAMGGGSKSPLWCQIVADIAGKPVTRSASPEATCLGAAILAATAAGFHSDVRAAAAAMVRLGESYTPHRRNRAIYDQLYQEVYRHIYPTLQASILRLAELTYDPQPGHP